LISEIIPKLGWKVNTMGWLAIVDDLRTANWVEIIPYPQFIFQEMDGFVQN